MEADLEDDELMTLDQIWRSTKMLNIACPLCKRRGRYRIQGLVDRYGASVRYLDSPQEAHRATSDQILVRKCLRER